MPKKNSANLIVKHIVVPVGLILIFSSCGKKDEMISINEQNFPDSNFRNYLVELDSCMDGDGRFSPEEINILDKLELTGVYDVSGVEYFSNLSVIKFTDCRFEKLSFEKNSELKKIVLDNSCDVITVDLSQNSNLEEVYCSQSGLKVLLLPKSETLKHVYCSNNNLSELDVSGSKGLTELEIYNNDIKELKIENCSRLKYLVCWGNDLSILNISGCSELIRLYNVDNKFGDDKIVTYSIDYDKLSLDPNVEIIEK